MSRQSSYIFQVFTDVLNFIKKFQNLNGFIFFQNKEKKDTIGESTTKRPFVRVDRDRDVEKEARKLQNAKTLTTPVSTVSTPLPPMSPVVAPPLVPAPPSSKGDRDSSNERDSSVDAKRDSSRGRKKNGNGKIRQKIAKRDPAEDESMNGEEKQHLAPNVDVTVGPLQTRYHL